jgi:activator of HSP90 ATPase
MRLVVIRQSVTIDAPPDEVYEAYVCPKKHAEVTGSPASGSPRVGGRFKAWDGYISGKYLKLQRGRLIVHEWVTTEWPEGCPPSLVELKLEPAGEGTKLTMIHRGVPEQQADGYAQGWRDYYWGPMKQHFKRD